MPPPRKRARDASPDVGDGPAPVPRPTRKAAKKATAQPTPLSSDDEVLPASKSRSSARSKSKPTTKSKIDSVVLSEEDDERALQTKSKAQATKKSALPSVPAASSSSKVADSQYAKQDNLLIPVDEACTLTGCRVYVDQSTGIIYDATLNQTNAGNNNNKFYRLQLLTNDRGTFKTWTRWGRVGAAGQSATLGTGSLESALREFDKKFKDKTGLTWEDRGHAAKPKKYVFVERSYEPDSEDDDETDEDDVVAAAPSRSRSASPVKSALPKPTQSLMDLIFNMQYMQHAMADMKYDSDKMPLGKLSKSAIKRGYEALKALSQLLDDPGMATSIHNASYGEAVENLSNTFYSYIPHNFGRQRPPVINSHEMLKKEVDMLGSLTELKDTDDLLKAAKRSEAVHALDAKYNTLGMKEMSPIDRSTAEFTNISDYLVKTRGATHGVNYEVLDVFRIERNGECDRFRSFGKGNSDRRLLWHGSRTTNFGGILSQGLRIAPPEAPTNGYMFGKGVYLADMSSKSANYCSSWDSGGHALLLLCEAELGDPMLELTDATYSAAEMAKDKGVSSTFGMGLTGPQAWKDAKCVHPSLAGVKMPDTTTPTGPTNVVDADLLYNEYICYDVAQVRLRYLLRVKM